jgi:hypothetical protein
VCAICWCEQCSVAAADLAGAATFLTEGNTGEEEKGFRRRIFQFPERAG